MQLLEPAVEPNGDTDPPFITLLVPAMNEEINIREFVSWCKLGLAQLDRSGEILIVDSSTDSTARLAQEAGARVLQTSPGGLGQAYKDGLIYAQGEFLILGDADCTYDFRHLKPFVDAYASGYEFVMGSRFRGSIEPGAMPVSHRYFGTPLTTWFLNVIFGTHYTDIHCGMRGISKTAFQAMDLRSCGWEYASEMVIKARQMAVPTTEVPIAFLRDRNGRQSHMKRVGVFGSFQAGFQNLKAMLVYGPSFFLLPIGLAMLLIGVASTLLIALRTVSVLGVTLAAVSQAIFALIALLGAELTALGVLSRSLQDRTGEFHQRLAKLLPFRRTCWVVGLLSMAGFAMAVPSFAQFLQNATVDVGASEFGFAILGGLAIGLAFSLFTTMLVVQLVSTINRK